MNETICNSEKPKAKVSKFAIISLIIPCISIIGSICFTFAMLTSNDTLIAWFELVNLIGSYLSGISFVLGILTIISIKGTRGAQKDVFMQFWGYCYLCLPLLFQSMQQP